MSFKTLKAKTLLTFCAVLFSGFLAGGINAQSGTTTINGTVADPQGRVIPNATVTLTNAEKGFSRNIVTTTNGTLVVHQK